MSEHITHIAICENIVRLVAFMPTVERSFRQSVTHFPDDCQMGSAAHGNHIFALPFIAKYRDQWNTLAWKVEVEIAYAFAVCWLGVIRSRKKC